MRGRQHAKDIYLYTLKGIRYRWEIYLGNIPKPAILRVEWGERKRKDN